MSAPVILALTQGDPAGVGPEILLKVAAERLNDRRHRLILVVERSALRALERVMPEAPWDRLLYLEGDPSRDRLAGLDRVVAVVDPVASRRVVEPGRSGAADAAGAIVALDKGAELVEQGLADALVTAPLSKLSVARHYRPDFRGHTEYLAARCGLERYGRDYLMAFLAVDLQVALLSTHVPLREAVEAVSEPAILDALRLLARNAAGRVAVAGLNPHAGEDGLLGSEDGERIVPAVARAREEGIDVRGPESADSLFARARAGEFDWVLALYHDQGLIAVKTAAFGAATNWTLGLPWLRTSVDHGTAFPIAGQGRADHRPLSRVVETTLEMLQGRLPRKRPATTPPAPSTPRGSSARGS